MPSELKTIHLAVMHTVVWFKKDLRLSDHAPLAWATEHARAQGGEVLPLWVDELAMWQQAFSQAHRIRAQRFLASSPKALDPPVLPRAVQLSELLAHTEQLQHCLKNYGLEHRSVVAANGLGHSVCPKSNQQLAQQNETVEFLNRFKLKHRPRSMIKDSPHINGFARFEWQPGQIDAPTL
jgi:deoxyribodipyrimidine photolyase